MTTHELIKQRACELSKRSYRSDLDNWLEAERQIESERDKTRDLYYVMIRKEQRESGGDW